MRLERQKNVPESARNIDHLILRGNRRKFRTTFPEINKYREHKKEVRSDQRMKTSFSAKNIFNNTSHHLLNPFKVNK